MLVRGKRRHILVAFNLNFIWFSFTFSVFVYTYRKEKAFYCYYEFLTVKTQKSELIERIVPLSITVWTEISKAESNWRLAANYLIQKSKMVVFSFPQCHCYGWSWCPRSPLCHGRAWMVCSEEFSANYLMKQGKFK